MHDDYFSYHQINFFLMSNSSKNKRQLKHYIADFKREQTYCSQCQTLLTRVFLMRHDQVLNKSHLYTLKERVDEQTGMIFCATLRVLCRFCTEMETLPPTYYFDLRPFRQYLLSQSNANLVSIREYVVRLRRLDEQLSSAHTKQDSLQSLREYIDKLPLSMTTLRGYHVALNRYEEYLLTVSRNKKI